jgi:hypothetical protein
MLQRCQNWANSTRREHLRRIGASFARPTTSLLYQPFSVKKQVPALATGLLLLAASAGQAQTTLSFGPRLGANLSTFSYSGNSTGLDDTSYRLGVQVGGTLNVSFGKVAFQPSLLFSQKGATLKGSEQETSGGITTRVGATLKPRLHYLELPLNVVYTAGGDHGFQVFAGPYLAVGVGGGGSYKVSLDSDDPDITQLLPNGEYPGSLAVEYGDRQNDNSSAGSGSSFGAPTITFTARRFDAGFNAGVGYRVGPVQAQLGYGLGLVNFVPNDSDGNDTGSKAYHRGFQLAATYFFATN